MLFLSRHNRFLVLLAALFILLIPGFPADNNALDSFSISLINEFNSDMNEAISPDGKNIFISDWGINGTTASLIEIGTWKTVKSFNFENTVAMAEFFSDSQGLFFYNLSNSDRTVLDLRTGQQTAVKYDDPRSPYIKDSGFPVHDRRLLIRNRGESTPKTEDLVLVEFPSYEVIKKVPYATQPREPQRYDKSGFPVATERGFEISNNREILAYSVDNILVCRRTKDLEVLWSRKIAGPLKAYSIDFSPNGDYVAAWIADDGSNLRRTELYISVFDGNNGTELVKFKLPLLNTNFYAVSSNGRLLAFSEVKQGKNTKEWLSIAHIYELPSCRKLASVEHNRIRGYRDSLKTEFTIGFTPDGRYMVTIGNRIIKFWELGGTAAEMDITLRNISSK